MGALGIQRLSNQRSTISNQHSKLFATLATFAGKIFKAFNRKGRKDRKERQSSLTF
jgi:hypothetical protein